jgi:hypothetical protein
MRLIFILLAMISVALSTASAQAPAADRLAPVAWLVGQWEGVGEGQPGTSSSTRQAERLHGNRFLLVRGRSVYPKQESNRSGDVHGQVDIWSFDRARDLLVLRQFDTLGFVSTYVQDRAASVDGRIVLVSEQMENVPAGWRARYTFTRPAPDEYHELFELDSGSGYERYVFNRLLRTGGDAR